MPAAAIERGVIYVLAGDIAASRYTANPVISQQIMPFFRGILSNFFRISLTTLMWYIKLEKIGIVNIQCSYQLLSTGHFLIFTRPSATMSQLTHQSSNIQKTGKNICVTLRVRIFSVKHLSLSFVSSTLALILNLILITNHSLVHSASSEHGRLCDCNAGRT